jgi:hypothetical protein
MGFFERSDLCADALVPLDTPEHRPKPSKATLVQTDAQLLDLDSEVPLLMEPSTPPSDSFTILIARPEPVVDRIKPFPGSLEELRNPDHVIDFEIKKNHQNAKQIAIRISVFNLSASQFVNFNMRFDVSLDWKIPAQNPSTIVLEPIGWRSILQQLLVLDEADTKLRMKTQILYLYGI